MPHRCCHKPRVLVLERYGLKCGCNTGPAHAHASAPAAVAHLAQEHANNLINAHALENGLLTTLLIPLVLKFIIYTFLYCEGLSLLMP